VRYLTVRITNQQRLIANLVTVDSEQRLAQTLLHPAHELGHKERNDPIKGKPDLALCFKPSYLSSLALPTVELLDPRDLCSNPDLHCDIYPLTIGFQARSSHSALPDDTLRQAVGGIQLGEGGGGILPKYGPVRLRLPVAVETLFDRPYYQY
jgi:hypothetical protein